MTRANPSPAAAPSARRDRGRAAQRLVENGSLWPLAPAALAMGVLSELRNALFASGLRRSQQPPLPTLCVGNVVAGGSGKTPLVAWLGRELRHLGQQPAVIARGYGGVDGSNDEAMMLDLPVFCNPQRIIAARQAAAGGATLLLMDDALQHRQCARHMNLICIDASRPWGWPGSRRGALLPWGLMRERASALRRGQGVVLTRCDQAHLALQQHVRAVCRHWHLPLFACAHEPQGLRRVETKPGPRLPLSQLQGQRVWACSAIARPQSFVRSLRDVGAEVVGESHFADHHRFSAAELQQLARQAERQRAQLLCTAKDAVKIAPLLETLPPAQRSECPWYSLEIDLKFSPGDGQQLMNMVRRGLALDGPLNLPATAASASAIAGS